MSKLVLLKNSGSINDAKTLEFEIADISNKHGIRVSFENATHNVDGDIAAYGKYLPLSPNDSYASGQLDLRIPEHAADVAVTVFATIEEKDENDQYKTTEVVSAVYDISSFKSTKRFAGKMRLNNSYLGIEDRTVLAIEEKPNSRVTLSINDKRLSVHLNKEGKGTLTFYGKDVFSKSAKVIQKFPVYIFTSDDNYTEPQFTGSFVNVLPDRIATLQACDADTPLSECTALVANAPESLFPEVDDKNFKFEQQNSEVSVHVSNCNDVVKTQSGCGINSYSADLLPNGQIVYAYAAQQNPDVDPTTQKLNKIFLDVASSSVAKGVFGRRGGLFNALNTGILQPSTAGEIDIQVDSTFFDHIQIGGDIVIFDSPFDGGKFSVIAKDADAYNGIFKVTIQSDEIVDKLGYCVNLLYANEGCEAGTSDILLLSTPFINNLAEEKITAANPSIAASPLVETNNISHVYVVAQGLVDGIWQLFLYSIRYQINQDCGATADPGDAFGWVQLTVDGENKNPKTIVDSIGNLHIVWESSRTGQVQLYYSALGPSAMSLVNGATSSFIDKYAQTIQKENKPFDYVQKSLFRFETARQFFDSEYGDFNWINFIKGGSLSRNNNQHLLVTGNTTEDQAISFSSLSTESEFPWNAGNVDQISYEINFNLKNNNDVSELSVPEIDRLYDTWKAQFTPVYSADLDNTSSYEIGKNKFMVGRRDEFYDRIIPIVGSYRNAEARIVFNDGQNSSEKEFRINASDKDNETLRHFVLALIPEKSQFQATNIETVAEFAETNDLELATAAAEYNSEIETVVNTGRYKLAITLNSENYVGKPSGKTSTISRRFSEPFNLIDEQAFKIQVNYTKMHREDTASMRGVNLLTNDDTDLSRLWCNVTIFLNEQVIFAESFMTDMTDRYTSFDIGLGIPGGGQYTTNDFALYENNVFDDLDVSLEYSNITIGPPTAILENELINLPSSMRFDHGMVDFSTKSKPLDTEPVYLDDFDLLKFTLLDSGTSGSFPQIPVTTEGVNQSANLDLGLGYDLHITWQSNRDNYWNVFYASSMDRQVPFRYETIITDTTSNSIMPSIGVSRTGARMIAWHDDRDGFYQVYAATSPETQTLTGLDLANLPVVLNDGICRDPDPPDPPTEECQIDVEFCLEGCCVVVC